MRRFFTISLISLLLVACKKNEPAPAATATQPAAVATTSASTSGGGSAATAPTTAAAESQPSLVSFSAGALIAQRPAEYSDNWSALWILDEDSHSGWATPKGVIAPQSIVIALPEKTQLDRLEFDNASVDGEGRGAKDISVEVSDSGPADGFQKIADVSLQDRLDRQSFPVSAKVSGRWVRLNVKNNHGSTEYIELMDFRGYGSQLTHTPFANASGTYDTNYGHFHLSQEGTSVTGCYEHAEGLLKGGIEGRIMKFTWYQSNGEGPAIMVFTPDGKQMFGLWSYKGHNGANGTWDGKKISDEVGNCPHWSSKGGVAQQMTSDLESLGRTRLYGINFDTDSDVIRDESKPTLDKIAAMLKAKPDWKLTIEGHTDSTGGDAHNRDLSQRRAESVRKYLVVAAIAADRLTATGRGASVPLATNDTASGRAQNRRVELAKQ
ncbi:MAG TPA: OmpA family protein [Thermoanaerobaculia bacterium]|nr:OmpA family protein [Thermoanaerobaculia bacterium]